MDELTGGVFEPSKITRVSVFSGHEDDSLLKFFPTGFICMHGDRINFDDQLASIVTEGGMWNVHGQNGETPQAFEQSDVVCSNLNSNEAYIVVPPGADIVFAWSGEGASEEEIKYALKFANFITPGKSVSEIKEGEEPEEFFTALGGKTEYLSSKELNIAPGFEARLFQCGTSQGYFHMKELDNFIQEDLNIYDIMVVDLFSTIYMWIGNKSNKTE